MTEERLFLELAEKFHVMAAKLAEIGEAVSCQLELIHRELVEISDKLDDGEIPGESD